MTDAEILPPWLVVISKPQCEGRAYASLLARGFTAFMPTCQIRRKRLRRERPHLGPVVRYEPLFPGYLFVEYFEPTFPWARIRWDDGANIMWAPGVMGILTHPDGQVGSVSGSEIELLKQRMVTEPIQITEDGAAVPPVVGGLARVTSGSFTGLSGIVEGTKKDRVLMLLDLVGREVRVSIPVQHVVPA